MTIPSVPTEEVVDLSPFKRMVMTIGTLPTAFTESMTYYEALAYFVKYLEETIIPAINQNAQATEELQTLFTELHDYVENYFENLDVQEEINNKLDDMAESGQLADIIAQYLNLACVLGYNTKEAMKQATNLVDGSIARTLGSSTYDDGKGAFYKIREIRNTDVVDDDLIVALADESLVAEKIIDYTLNQKIFYFDTLSNMKVSPYLQAGSAAKTLGYYTLNDKGGATYTIRESEVSDDVDEMFIVAITGTTLVAELVTDNTTNILQLGAKHSGDNSAVLQKAINKLSVINIPAGNYSITQDVELKPYKTIKGDGEVNILVANTCQIYTSENQSSNYSLNISNITFRFNDERSTYGLDLKDWVYSTIDNCIFRSDNGTNQYNGVRILKSAGQCYDDTIVNCFFQKSCLMLDKATDMFIRDCKIWANDLTAAAIDMIDNCGNCLIKGNHIIGGTLGGIRSVGTEKILMRILHNYFDGRAKGICGSTYKACTIANNTFFNMAGRPIEIQQLFNSSVTSNAFYAKDIPANYEDFVITYNHGSNIISNNTHYRENVSTTDKKPYEIVSNTPLGTTVISNANIMYHTNFANQTGFTDVVFKDCYPTAKFPNS